MENGLIIADRLKAFVSNSASHDCPIHEFAFVTPANILFKAEVRAACESNACGRYGKCWTCPPGVGDWQALRDHYKLYPNAFVFTSLHSLEDSFDVDGMNDARAMHNKLDLTILDLLKGVDRAFELLSAGSCELCDICTYPHSPCRNPLLARRSVEATGIDVVSLAHDSGLHYFNGVNTVTYFSVLFF